MEERPPTGTQEDVIDLGKYFAVLGKEWWRIALLSFGFGLLTFLLMFLMPNVYQSIAVIGPAIAEKRPIPALGALASFGVDFGSPSKVEDLETLFNSKDLTVRVFRNHLLWPIVLPDSFDPATGKIKVRWTDYLFGGEKDQKTPGDWDAIRAVMDRLKVSVNRKAGTISVSFESPSPEGSAEVVKYYLDEGKNRLQEEALDRAIKNKKFIEEQIGKTVDALTRDRLYSLYGQEVEQEMMARNREQFGFRVIDSARIPEKKSGPRRGKAALLAMLLSAPLWAIVLGYRSRKAQSR